MAQLQDIIAKRKELMGTNSNLSYNDAMAQARQQVAGTTPTVTPTPTPTTPVTPTPTPVTPVAPVTPPIQATPTVQPTQTQPQDNWMGDFSGIQKKTTIPTAPVTPVTPTPINVTPALVTTPEPVKPTTVKTEPVIDYNQGLGREQDIAKNLQTFKDQGMTADAIKNASGYNTASPEKKAQIDGFLGAMTAPVAMDQKDIVKSLISGVAVPIQKTRAYNNAVVMADEYKKFNGMTDVQLLDNLKQGQIGTEMSSLLSQNPNFAKAKEQYNKIQQTNSINRATNAAMNAISGKENPVIDDLTKIESKYSAPLGSDQAAYEKYVTTNEDVVNSATQVKQLTKQISEVTTTYNQALKDLKKQYPDMPASALLTLMGSRTGETKSLLDSLIEAKTIASGDFDLAMKMAEGHYNAVSKDIAQANILKNKKDELQLTADFQKQQQEAALKDPAKAIQTTIDEYKKLGIPFTSTVQSRLAEFEKSGLSLPDYLTQMRTNIQQSPAYQNYARLQAGQLSDVQKMQMGQQYDIQKMQLGQQYDMSKMGMEQSFQMKIANAKNITSNKWTKLDDGLYTNESGQVITADELKMAKLTDNKYLSTGIGQEGGDCGFYASRATGAGSTPGGNSKEARVKAFSDKTPQVGGMVFFGGSGYDKTYGHVSVVTGVNADGTIDVKESNYNNNGKVTERTVPASSATGFYNNTPLAKGLNGGTTENVGGKLGTLAQFMIDNQDRGQGYSNDDVKAFNEKINRMAQAGDDKGMAIAYRNMVMKDKDFKKEFDDTRSFTTALDTVQKLIDDYEKAGKSTTKLNAIAETIGRKLGMTTDVALAQLQTQMGTTMANYVKSISGTAASDAEVQRLMGNMANIGNVKDLNTAIVSQVKQNAMNGIKSMIDTRMYGMPEELKPQVFGDIYGTNNLSNSKLSSVMSVIEKLIANAPK